MAAHFAVGDLVQVKNGGQTATISRVSEVDSAVYYYVFIDGKKRRYAEEDLLPYVDTEDQIYQAFDNREYQNADRFQRFIYYQRFSDQQDTNIYSYQGNRILFNPFQYKPLLKFLSADSDERLLIADEVGVGKTIESGIILDELMSRNELSAQSTILIVCPNVLCLKWQAELKNRFLMDDFWIHDGKSLKFSLESLRDSGRNPYPHSIVSEQLLRGNAYQELMKDCKKSIAEPFIQMLIVDECHHYRNPTTNTHQVGMLLSTCAERVVMLSATPFNLRSEDLFFQLHMLNPSLFSDEHEFHILKKQIHSVNQCISLLYKSSKERIEMLSLLDELGTLVQHSSLIRDNLLELYDRIKRMDELSSSELAETEKLLNMLNPLASSFTRTLKRDAIEHRVTRDVRTIEVHFTPEESDIYDSFIDVSMLRHQFRGVSEKAFGLISNGLERIAASSLIALENNINHYMHISLDGIDDSILQEEYCDLDEKTLQNLLRQKYEEVLDKIHALNGYDSKYSALKKLASGVKETFPENNRIIIFSFYVGTLKYLRKKLSADGYRVGLMYGKTPKETPQRPQYDEDGFLIVGRQDLITSFKQGEYDIMLLSEVGGEGLDYQFCAAMVNYDLPYNPMRIEQRIGRIDRMGQLSDKIVVGSLCIAESIDMVINRVLLSRIDDAADLMGELEPIIAQELEEMNQLIISREFSAGELAKREREIVNRIEKERITREEFDNHRFELVNDKSFRDVFEADVKKSRVSPRESFLFTAAFLKALSGCWSKPLSQTMMVIHLSNDLREKLASYNRRMKFGANGQELIPLIRLSEDIVLSFDGEESINNSGCHFIKPSGPWIHFMIDYIKALESEQLGSVFHCTLPEKAVPNLSKGNYLVYIYDVSFSGFRNSCQAKYILIDTNHDKVVCIEDEHWNLIFQNVQQTKKNVVLDINHFDDARILADREMDLQLVALKNKMMAGNEIRIASRIDAIKKLTKTRIKDYQNDLIGATSKEAERIRRSIDKEEKKANEKIAILESKRNLSADSSLRGVCILDVV